MPSTYNLDFQEITPRLWESLGSINSSLDMLSKLIPQLKVAKNVFNKSLHGFSTATELANMFVRKHKVPFRTAHKIVGSLVKKLIDDELVLSDVTPKLIQKVAKMSCNLSLNVKMEDIRASTSPSEFVKAHNVSGGPSPEQVKKMLKTRKQWFAKSKARLVDEKSKLNKVENLLKSVIKSYLSSDNSKGAKLKSENR